MSVFGSDQQTTVQPITATGHSNAPAGAGGAAASDAGTAVGLGGHLVNTGAGGVTQYGSGKLIGSGSVDFSGSKGQIGGIQLSGKGASFADNSVTTTADPQVAAQAIAAVADVSKQFGTQLSTFLTQTGQQSAAQQQATVAAIGQLAQGQQAQTATDNASTATGGLSNFSKPALIFFGLVALVIVAFFWRKK